MKTEQTSRAAYRPGQHLQIMDDVIHDPFQEREKYSEPTVCKRCHAVYHKGHWQWLPEPENANLATCPACKRIEQKIPAGYVSIKGDFAQAHLDEILNLVRNYEAREKAEHTQKRIMEIEHLTNEWLVTTTDIHLAHGIGEALHKAYQGELDAKYNEGEYLLRVSWHR